MITIKKDIENNCSFEDQKVQVCDAREAERSSVACFIKKLLLLVLSCCIIEIIHAQHTITLHFENFAGNKLLQSDSSYSNAFGEIFTIRNFRYYISNIELTDASGETQSFPGDYFLVDNAIDSSKTILITTSLKNISSIHFLLGVDSLKNVSGVQTGTLDPARGMFWTWNSGYVMAKLEGNSASAKMPAHAFSYHIGGYMHDEQAARTIDLVLQKNISAETQAIINIKADILKWFDGMHQIKIADVAFCHEPGKTAMLFADNYSNMFSIIQAQ